jgi:solute carrier family 25 protein 34/35
VKQSYYIGLRGSLGFYEPFRRTINRAFGWTAAEQIPVTSLVAGAASGAVGGLFYHGADI